MHGRGAMSRVNKLLHWPRKKVFAFLVKRAGLEDRIKRFGVKTPEELYEKLVEFAMEASDQSLEGTVDGRNK